jgi:hypothetical protein
MKYCSDGEVRKHFYKEKYLNLYYALQEYLDEN